MTRKEAVKNQNGQAFLEAVIGFPALVLVLAVFILSVIVFGLRIHLVFVTQELATCRLSIKIPAACEEQARRQTREILEHWGFHAVFVKATTNSTHSTMQVQASWGENSWKRTLHWSFQEKVPFQTRH